MSNPRLIYVGILIYLFILVIGGLDENVNEAVLHSAFIPFGDIISVQIAVDNGNGKSRGFGFVEYEEVEDAKAAIDNMHSIYIYINVNIINL